MFQYKSEEELSKMSAAERDKYAQDKRAHEAAENKKALDAALSPLNDEIKGLKTEVNEAKEKANQAAEQTAGFKLETIESEVGKFIKENHSKIKSLRSQGHGLIEFEIKAVGTITSGNQVVTTGGATGTAGIATNPDGIPQIVGVQQAPPTDVNLRTVVVETMVNRFNTNLAAYPYTEVLPKDGDFDFVAEGNAKPQVDLKIETRYAQPVKVAGWEHLTEESIQDIPGLQSIATGYLRKKHDIRKQRGILFGSGTYPQPKGATLYGRTFVAGAMANTVRFPNFMDVVNAAITDVFTTHNFQDEMPYQPSLVLINPVDFFVQLVSAKDERGLPLYPTASLFNRVNIGGVTIMPEEMIPVGKIFVADMSKYNVSDYVGYVVKIGWINDDFIKNQFVILGESRFHAFVKRLDQQAFIYDDIATIKDAIAAPLPAAA
jgi:HK97 family phage major capsid protein